MLTKDKAALVLALSMFTGASMAADAGAGAAQGDAVEGQSPLTQQDGAYEGAAGASPPPGHDGARDAERAEGSPTGEAGAAAGQDAGTPGQEDAAAAPGMPPPGHDGARDDEVQQWASDEDRERFENLDTAGTGYITREEAEADPELAGRFDEVDRDQTGVISEAEFAQFLEEQQQNGAGVSPDGGPDGNLGSPAEPREGVQPSPADGAEGAPAN